jgi:hypothetical protein
MGMRIGTWNVDARWDRRHERLVTGQVCDVWLLTETPSTLVVPGFRGRVTAGRMSRGQHWARGSLEISSQRTSLTWRPPPRWVR